MSAIYYKGQKYTGPTLNLGSGSLTTDDKTIVGGINEINSSLENKQNTLVSGTNIKTINNESILGSGNISINVSIPNNITGSGTSGYLAKFNGADTITNGPALGSSTTTYLRNDGAWGTPVGTTYSVATTSANGLMSSTDKVAVNKIGTGTLNTTNKNIIAAINELKSALGYGGIVSYSVTAGAAHESTHNYIRLKGNIQICFGTVYSSSGDFVDFAAAFSGLPYIVSNLAAVDSSSQLYQYVSNITNLSSTGFCTDRNSTDYDIALHYIAIGKYA